MTRLLTSTELHLTTAGVRASVVAKKMRLAGEVVGGLGYWLTLDTSG
ncbi:MAG: hypothetical protein K8U57_32120 [Planctomycetes bacterium]|nr:hypothetical protein [Planctomycetota bacterium]